MVARVRVPVLATAVATAALLAGTVPALAATGTATNLDAGVVAGRVPLAKTAADTQMRISIVLRPQNFALLKARVGGGYYRQGNFLSVKAFTAMYGQPRWLIKAYVHYLHAHGLKTQVFADRLNIAVSGPAAAVNAAFNVALKDYRIHGSNPQIVHGTSQKARLPRALAARTLAVFGLASYHGQYKPSLVRAHLQHRKSSGDGPPAGQLLPSDYLRLYHGKTLQTVSHKGAGQTIGIVTLASLNVPDAFNFWHILGIKVSPNRITLRNIDGGSGAPSLGAGSDETALDVQQSGAIAPAANMIVYQAPNSDVGFNDAYFAAVSSNKADSFSTSWGDSETWFRASIATGVGAHNALDAQNVPLLEAGAQGQATFAASGDEGAYDASADVTSTNLDVDWPATSPYTTSAGGTTLSSKQYPQNYGLPNGKTLSIVIPHERAWAWDYLWPSWKEWNAIDGTSITEDEWAFENSYGAGGGMSAYAPMPAYQKVFPGIDYYRAVHNMTPTAYTNIFPDFAPLPFKLPSDWIFHFDPKVSTGTVRTTGRMVPDLSANADPATGYGIYSELYPDAYGTYWQQFGGTSFTSPQFNGSSALIQAQAGGRVGLWNTSIYRFATGRHTPIAPLNTGGGLSIGQTVKKVNSAGTTYVVPGNNNLYWAGRTGTRYNMATGLGIPNLTALGRAFAR